MIPVILAALFPQWRDRDDRLCREIVARGICAPTSDLGIAVRATLARVDALRAMRDDAEERWEDAIFSPAGTGALGATVRALRDEAATLRGIHRDMLRVVGERDEARAELARLRDGIRDMAERLADNG